MGSQRGGVNALGFYRGLSRLTGDLLSERGWILATRSGTFNGVRTTDKRFKRKVENPLYTHVKDIITNCVTCLLPERKWPRYPIHVYTPFQLGVQDRKNVIYDNNKYLNVGTFLSIPGRKTIDLRGRRILSGKTEGAGWGPSILCWKWTMFTDWFH